MFLPQLSTMLSRVVAFKTPKPGYVPPQCHETVEEQFARLPLIKTWLENRPDGSWDRVEIRGEVDRFGRGQMFVRRAQVEGVL